MKKPPEGSIFDVALTCCYAVLEWDAYLKGINIEEDEPPDLNELDRLHRRMLDLATIAVARAETDPGRN